MPGFVRPGPREDSDRSEDLESLLRKLKKPLVCLTKLSGAAPRLEFEICASRDCQDRPVGVSDCEFKS